MYTSVSHAPGETKYVLIFGAGDNKENVGNWNDFFDQTIVRTKFRHLQGATWIGITNSLFKENHLEETDVRNFCLKRSCDFNNLELFDTLLDTGIKFSLITFDRWTSKFINWNKIFLQKLRDLLAEDGIIFLDHIPIIPREATFDMKSFEGEAYINEQFRQYLKRETFNDVNRLFSFYGKYFEQFYQYYGVNVIYSVYTPLLSIKNVVAENYPEYLDYYKEILAEYIKKLEDSNMRLIREVFPNPPYILTKGIGNRENNEYPYPFAKNRESYYSSYDTHFRFIKIEKSSLFLDRQEVAENTKINAIAEFINTHSRPEAMNSFIAFNIEFQMKLQDWKDYYKFISGEEIIGKTNMYSILEKIYDF